MLCVNAYSIQKQSLGSPSLSLLPSSLQATGSCVYGSQGLENSFIVVSRRSVNGLNITFGKLNRTVLVDPTADVVLSYFATNLGAGNPNSGVLSAQQGVLLPDCNQTRLRPCAVNIVDQVGGRDSYGLFRSSTGVSDKYALKYWGNLSQDPWSTVKRQSPALETVIAVCSAAAPPSPFDCRGGPDWLKNYYSPVPVFPAFVEVAVTPQTQSLACDAAQYKAPHPPMRFKSFDLDGHRMTQYDFFSRAKSDLNSGSNRRAECFRSEPAGQPSAMGASTGAYDPAQSGDPAWPWGACPAYFDQDQDPARADGALIKFDFDFGNQLCTGPGAARTDAQLQQSVLFGNLSGCGPAGATPCAYAGAFSQHVINTADFPYIDVDQGLYYDPDAPAGTDWLRWFSVYPPLSADAVAPKGAVTQTIFSAYPCWSGPLNAPPAFVAGPGAAPDSHCRGLPAGDGDAAVQTEYSCPAGQECTIALYARDLSVGSDGLARPVPSDPARAAACAAAAGPFLSADTVQILPASGWDEGGFRLVVAHCSGDSSRACVRDADCPSLGACSGSSPSAAIQPVGASTCTGPSGLAGGAVKCVYKQTFGLDEAGTFVVRCFTARDLHPAPVSNDSRTCQSVPLCLKIKVTGHAPYFAAPTPVRVDGLDSSGAPVTRVGACEGAPLQLMIAALDDDPSDLVRLLVQDESGGGTSFFDGSALSQTAPACARGLNFGPYAATLAGAAAAVPNMSTVLSLGFGAGINPYIRPGSVVSPYAAGLYYQTAPNSSVVYTLNLTLGNGIAAFTGTACGNQSNITSSIESHCLETAVALDRTICAYAYDNSRGRLKRWVGSTNPNGNSSLATHSDGDISTKHCWRISLQAPPVFVTDPSRTSTPFPRNVNDICKGNNAAVSRQIRCFEIFVGQTIQKTFIAQDPNPSDSIILLLVDDPDFGGPPPGLTASRPVCLPRMRNASGPGTDGTGMCSPIDFSVVNSACSKAMMTVEWTPDAAAVGGTYFACVAARDSSGLCSGIAEGATSMGWYSETHCIGFTVLSPTLSWAVTSDIRSSQLSVQKSFVGCQSRFKISVVGQGTNAVEIFLVHPAFLPAGAELVDIQEGIAATKLFLWIPSRGMEGMNLTVCFSAKDQLGALAWGETGCRLLSVQRCQYCVGGGNTLTHLMKSYGLDTNWLRLWLHNSAVLDNPDLIPRTKKIVTSDDGFQNALDSTVLYVGPVYEVQEGDSLTTIAFKFRTTVIGLLSVNPDLKNEENVVIGRELCIIPCSQKLSAGGMM